MSAANDFFESSQSIVQPKREVLCYEAIWSVVEGVTFKFLESWLHRTERPSFHYSRIPQELKDAVQSYLSNADLNHVNVLIRGTADYPNKLEVLEVPLLYYSGDISLIDSPCVSIVGARKASERGRRAAAMIAEGLALCGYTVVSGLATGIDTAAHSATIAACCKTIGVIGTPLNQVYPKENKSLQEKIGRDYLLLSHVPFFKYSKQNYKINRGFFPERNKVMAALSEATIIAEASDTSGSLIQAREAMRIGKKVIILKPSYDDHRISWPKTYVAKGAIVADNLGDIKEILGL